MPTELADLSTEQAQAAPPQTVLKTESQPTQIDPSYPTSTSLLSRHPVHVLLLPHVLLHPRCMRCQHSHPHRAPQLALLHALLCIALGGLVSLPLLLLLTTVLSGRLSDRFGAGDVVRPHTAPADARTPSGGGSPLRVPFVFWALIAFGFSFASTCCLSLLSNELPETYTRSGGMAIQYSNYAGRVSGAILGESGVKMGMVGYVGVQLGVVGLGPAIYLGCWRQLKTKTD